MKILLSFSFIVLSIVAYAQPRVITFDSDQKEKDGKSERNVVKISVLELASGDFPIYYERAIGKKIALEGSLGITFGDYFGGLSSFSGSEISPLDRNVSAKYGYSLSASVRIYPIEVLEEFYIAPEFKFRKYNWDRDVEYYIDQAPYSVVRRVTEHKTYAMPRISFGYVFFYDTNLSFDYYMGIGMNNPTETVFNENNFKVEKQKLNTRPRLHFGVKIGYFF